MAENDAAPAQTETPRKDEAATENDDAAATSSDSGVPWYLEVEPPRHPTLIPKPPQLPDIPEGSPRLLRPLLEFASDDLGLDDLNLLDLRSLDTPPALGPNLLMLFGTARSQRHLHVSADRLVRWSRGRGIGATADGLLGRNELKTKLRRKARRAKLMGHAAAPTEDDGIATRWICVNLGTTEWTTSEDTEIMSDDGSVKGFGTTHTGTTVVVQMLTESKREELDLEGMWNRVLRGGRDAAATPKETTAPKPPKDPIAAALEGSLDIRGARSKSMPQNFNQRFFSTSSRRPAEAVDLAAELIDAARSVNGLELSQDMLRDRSQKVRLLEKLQSHIDQLPLGEAVGSIRPESDTPTRRLCELALADLPTEDTWGHRVWHHAICLRLGQATYDITHLRELVTEMRLSGIAATRTQSLAMLQAIFARSGSGVPLQDKAALATEVLESMFERGETIVANDTLVAIVEALARSGPATPELQRLQSVLEKLILQAKLPCPDEESLVALLRAYAAQDNWDRFWETWRTPPRFGQPRSATLYARLYSIVAGTKDQARCIDAVRWCYLEMLSEKPPVLPAGPVLHALKLCIAVADPRAEEVAQKHVGNGPERRRLGQREFVKVLRHAQLLNT